MPVLRSRAAAIAALCSLAALCACSRGTGQPRSSARVELLRRMPSGSSLLFVSVGGSGGGQVSTPDAQLGFVSDDVFEQPDVKGAYWAYVPAGGRVTLSATPATGSVLTGWFGTCAGTGTCTVTLGGNVDVGVEFDVRPAAARSSYALSVHALSSYRNLSPRITASPAGVSLACSSGGAYVLDCSADVPAGTEVTLTAQADPAQPQFVFQGWGGQCTGTGTCTVTMSRDVSVTAGFGTAGSPPQTAACTVANGSGMQTWSGSAYGPCTVTACDAGFADCDGSAANGCEVSLQTDAASCGACGRACPAVPNGTPACTAGACGVAACSAGYTLAGGACVATTVPCAVANGTGTRTWSGAGYGSCNATSCASGFHLSNNACAPDVLACAVANGTGAQTWTGTAYTACLVVSCNTGWADCDANPADGCEASLTSDPASCGACGAACAPVPNGTAACTAGACGVAACNPGYVLAASGCIPSSISCPVANGTGTQTWDGVAGAYGTCTVASCNAGYHAYANACAPDVISCTVANGSGTQTWTGTSYAACVVTACSAGWANCDGSSADGCEANLATDSSSCGACGHACAAGTSCAGGSCVASKRVFVSSQSYTGNLGGLAGADAKCQALAQAAGLSGTYLAWLSTSTASPSTRFTRSAVPYVLVDGTVVAQSWAGLVSGNLLHAINLTERRGPAPTSTFCGPGNATVWTDTTASGTLNYAPYTCGDWTSTSGGGIWGNAAYTTSWWSSWCSGGTCSYLSPIYCVEQ